ncbi:MAG TPA: hypothetical protein VHD62_17015 [Opitutaceae bacterium]|nr:hypothetical protein [Opitutaceae bacterium]
MRSLVSVSLFVLSLGTTDVTAAEATPPAAAPAPARAAATLSDFDRGELALFERKATLAKRLGATHVPLTDGLPAATWQFQPPDDPYPAWFIQRPDFLKLFPPAEVRPFVDMNYGERIATILEERCKILRRLGLKAHWAANIPQVLPEAFFTAYPQLRGPRVDQPNRSKTARFSMCVDQPETLRLYGEAMKNLLARCPEIETFSFLTQDSGSGFCWVPALYPGINGNSECKDRPMADRISSFLIALHDAAKTAGHEVEINLNPIVPRQWMLPSFSPEQLDAIAHKLPRGIAVQGREGPDGRPFAGLRASDAYARGAFYPVVGVAVPDLRWLRTGRSAGGRAGSDPVSARRRANEQAERAGETNAAPAAPRRLISLRPEEALMEFNARLAEATQSTARASVPERMAALRSFAVSEAGDANADALLATWLLLDDADRRLEALDFGDMLQFGHVLNRWINRPMVPFPEELSAAEKSYYRPFLFQAKGEEQANDLIDIQGMRMYEGYGAHLLFQRVIETVVPDVETALAHIRAIRDAAPDDAARARWDLFGRRLEVVVCLLHGADNMVAYQAQLDRVKARGVKPEPNPVLGVQSSWDRTDLMETARKEIDNTVRLARLLQGTSAPLLDLAPVREEETIMRLGPDLAARLKRKVDLMNAHWIDYDRLFTAPNP